MIGALLLDASVAWPAVKDIVTSEQLVRHDHRVIFEVVESLMADTGAADIALVIDRLGGQIEEAGGRDYLADLVAECPSAANAAQYAREVRRRAGGSKVVNLLDEVRARARSPEMVSAYAAELERLASEYADAVPRRPIQWKSIEGKDPPPREWFIADWLTTGPTLLAGAGGVGKTLLAQTVATALALGRNFIGEVMRPVKVLMWACEDDHDELWRRQVAICRHFGVPLAALEGKLYIEPRLGMENTLLELVNGKLLWTRLRRELTAQINDYDVDVFWLDNISHTYGGNENNRNQVTAFANGLIGAVGTSRAIVAMGHPAKTADSEFSGSTAWENAMRMRWYMGYRLPDQPLEEAADEDPGVRYLAKRKTNYSVKDYRKLLFTDGLFVPDGGGVASFARRYGHLDRQQGADECVLAALRKIAAAGIRVTDAKNSPDYLPRRMRDMGLADDFSRKELDGALSRLRLAGTVAEGVVGQYPNRAPKTGLVISEECTK